MRDSFNAVFVEGDAVGQLMLLGRGAGGLPTASAVLGDLVDAAHNLTVKGAARKLELHAVPLRPIDDLRCAYYLSLFVADRPGVLAAIAGALGRHHVSVRSMEQDAPEPETGARPMPAPPGRGRGARGPPGVRHPPGLRARHAGLPARAAPARRRPAHRRPGPGGRPLSAPAAWRGVIEEYREHLPVSGRTPVVTLLEGARRCCRRPGCPSGSAPRCG